jgi:putative ABC transport system ATP-binding protein
MRELNEVEKTTFIFSTHDPEVLKYAKNVVKIRDGEIIQWEERHEDTKT